MGTQKKKFYIVIWVNNRPEDLQVGYYESGKKKAEINGVNDKVNGPEIDHHESGKKLK